MGKIIVLFLSAVLSAAGIWFTCKSYTDPILARGAVAELAPFSVNGDRQWLLVRGCDRRNPVILFIHGGPGMPAMYSAHAFQRSWERDFVVAHWDQRGAGKSFHSDLDPNSLSVSQMLADAVVVVNHLRKEFGVEKVIVVGHSHGTYLGALLAQQRPDLISAYVGLGQIADPARQRAVADALIRERLHRLGRTAPRIDAGNREDLLFETHSELARSSSFLPLLWIGLTAPEYSLTDALNVQRGPPFARRHLKDDVGNGVPPTAFQQPVAIVMGERDAVTPVALAKRWFDAVKAPSKQWTLVPDAAHFPHLEQPARVLSVLRDTTRTIGASTHRPDGAWPAPRFGAQCAQ